MLCKNFKIKKEDHGEGFETTRQGEDEWPRGVNRVAGAMFCHLKLFIEKKKKFPHLFDWEFNGKFYLKNFINN